MKAYPSYKPSPMPWLDKVPAHWGIMPTFSVLREKQHKNKGMIENTVLSLSYGKIVIKPPEKLHGLVPESFETYQIVDPQDIIIRPTDLQNDWTSLRVGLSPHRGIITSAYICLRAFGEITPEYAYLLLHTYDLLKVFYGMGSGLRQNLDFGDLKRMPVLLPSLDEQQAIISFLNSKLADIDRYITEKERLIELLQEQKTAIINQAVTRGINPNVKMKDSGIEWLGNIPANWNIRKLKFLIKKKLQYGANEEAALENRDFPRYIRITDFDNNGTLREDTFRSLQWDIAKDYLLSEGDILFARSGATVGKTFQFKNYSGKACFAGYLIKASPNEELIFSDFLYWFTKSGVYDAWRSQIFSQATIQNIGADKYSTLLVPFPSKEEQTRIINWLIEQLKPIDITIKQAERQIEIIQEFRSTLITEAVTGKIDVRN